MEPDLMKAWTRSEVHEELCAVLVESLGVDASEVQDDASLIHDLGAESIDFLDISFKAQQVFGVDLPTRLIQDQIIDWRNLHMLASIVEERYEVRVAAEELRMVTPLTLAEMCKYLRGKYELDVGQGEELTLAQMLASRLVSQMSQFGLDMTGVDIRSMANLLLNDVHSPKVMEEVLMRFTVGALTSYLCNRLAATARLRDAV